MDKFIALSFSDANGLNGQGTPTKTKRNRESSATDGDRERGLMGKRRRKESSNVYKNLSLEKLIALEKAEKGEARKRTRRALGRQKRTYGAAGL